jgi:hypothetical protein
MLVFWIVIRQLQSGKLMQLEAAQSLRLLSLQSDNQAQPPEYKPSCNAHQIPLQAEPSTHILNHQTNRNHNNTTNQSL